MKNTLIYRDIHTEVHNIGRWYQVFMRCTLKLWWLVVLLSAAGCFRSNTPTLFTDTTRESNIDFVNELVFTERLNPYTYRNFYNGAGVAIGDINNDGLLDIYFSGNQVDNKLYLNLGDFKFKDITEEAGVACKGVWSTGVTFVDINGDGYLDIYVCKSGDPDAPVRHNELFINNGDLTFTERSKEYGLDIVGLSVQAAFFDFDKDGDLDCYLLTNSFRSVGNYDVVENQRTIPDPDEAGNKFLINDNGTFRDYTVEAGIYRSNIGFGLGITLGDFNNDSWTDIYISNDFFERDYLYLNDQKGSFVEALTDYFQSISMGSMGADFADLDNDGFPELFVTEMLPDSLSRKKTKTIYENWDKYQLNVQQGYHFQFPRNVLQKRTSAGNYVEIGRLAGVSATEWSWGALLFDMDNDGYRDIFIANGIYKDLLDRDYLTYTGAADNIRKMIVEEKDVIIKLINQMPSSAFPNYAFKNEGNLKFKNVADQWGLGRPMFSNGSAYGDLDNDGDLDLVINNINGPSVLYRNNTNSEVYKSISVRLRSDTRNTYAVGAILMAYCGATIYYADNFVTRGFQSSVQPKVHIGLGKGVLKVDSLVIQWPDSGYTILYDIPVNQEIEVDKRLVNVQPVYPFGPSANRRNTAFRLDRETITIFKHKGSGFNDFNRDRLLPAMYSNETPSLLKGKVKSSGDEFVYVGGGKDQSGVFIRFKDGKFETVNQQFPDKFRLSEETKGAFIDVNGDGHLDFYMALGGRFFSKSSSALADQIFLNDGTGKYYESPHPLPFTEFVSTSVVVPIDFDNDGDFDLFVGERYHPFVYGLGGRGYLLENNGAGVFKDVTREYAPDLLTVGMITDAIATDINGDGLQDLVLVGDWMPIVALQNLNGKLTAVSADFGFENTEGWWNEIKSADLNQDGKVDFIVANHGLNSFFRAGDRMYVNDFDGNGSVDQIFCTAVNGKYYPVADKDEFLSQLPSFKKYLLYYKDYGKKSIEELIPEEVLKTSRIYQVNHMTSTMFLSGPNGYERIDLPIEAQYSPLYSLLIADFDKDGVLDLIAGGNQYMVKPQYGRYDASNSWFFKGDLNNGKFTFTSGLDLNVKGQIRGIEYIVVEDKTYIVFAKHDDDLEIFKIVE